MQTKWFSSNFPELSGLAVQALPLRVLSLFAANLPDGRNNAQNAQRQEARSRASRRSSAGGEEGHEVGHRLFVHRGLEAFGHK